MNRRIDNIRLKNLERLIKEANSAANLARLAKTSSSYISQVRNQLNTATGTPRTIGNELSERLERCMGKKSGWMDLEHEDEPLQSQEFSAPKAKEYARSECSLLPLITWQRAANWPEVHEPRIDYDTEHLLCPVQCGENSFVLEVQGSSMEPKFRDGEMIFADASLKPQNGQYVIAHDLNTKEAMLRQLVIDSGRRYLQALNPDWPDKIIEMGSSTTVSGVVIFKGEPV